MENIASADAEITGAATWTVPDGVTIHIGTQNGASGITTGEMGTTYWFGLSSGSNTIFVNFDGSSRIIGGLTLRQAGSAAFRFNGVGGGNVKADQLRMWVSSLTNNITIQIGITAGASQTTIDELVIDVDRETTTGSYLSVGGTLEIHNLVAEYVGSINAPFLSEIPGNNGKCTCRINSGDISSLGSGATIVGNCIRGVHEFTILNTILPASFVTLESQALTLDVGPKVFVQDCSTNGSAVPFAYADPYGEIRLDTGIYLTAGINPRSWKITTTANCTEHSAFYSPWIIQRKAAATVEPKFEVLRDGSATAYTDAEFWMENLSKITASSVNMTFERTRGTGTDIPAGAGTGSWTGEDGTAWSGELTIGSTVLEEDGYVLSRICAAVASSTIYVDPGAVG
jgi:hypothetical protein